MEDFMSHADNLNASQEDPFVGKLEAFAKKMVGDGVIAGRERPGSNLLRIRSGLVESPALLAVAPVNTPLHKVFDQHIWECTQYDPQHGPLPTKSWEDEQMLKKNVFFLSAFWALVAIAEGGLRIDNDPALRTRRKAVDDDDGAVLGEWCIRPTRRVTCEEISALMFYVNSAVSHETPISEIAAFVRTNRKDLDLLANTLADKEIEEVVQETALPGSPAGWFTAAKSLSLTHPPS